MCAWPAIDADGQEGIMTTAGQGNLPEFSVRISMDQNQLTSLFGARPQNFAWFVGAGASRSAGLPTAADIIWDLKRRYYCQEENQDISRQDINSATVKARIQGFMDSRGLPAPWAPDEYGTYFEKIF